MIGGDEVAVTGFTSDGRELPLLRSGLADLSARGPAGAGRGAAGERWWPRR